MGYVSKGGSTASSSVVEGHGRDRNFFFACLIRQVLLSAELWSCVGVEGWIQYMCMCLIYVKIVLAVSVNKESFQSVHMLFFDAPKVSSNFLEENKFV